MANTNNTTAANKLSLDIVSTSSREVKGSSGNLVPLTDDVFDKLSYGNQLFVALHEKFIGNVDNAIKYTNGFGIPQANLEAIAAKFAIV